MNVVAVVQQRMGSTRLPGKAGMLMGGRTLTEHVLTAAGYAVGHNNVVLAVPSQDDFSFLRGRWRLVRGPEDDVLTRLVGAVEAHGRAELDYIVRLTGDCPLVPVLAIEAAITEALAFGHDYVETRSDPSTRPNGIDVQVFTWELMWTAFMLAEGPAEREHVTPAIKPIAVNPGKVDYVEGLDLDDLPPLRITVDTRADFERVEAVIRELGPNPLLVDIMELYDRRPDMFVLEQQ